MRAHSIGAPLNSDPINASGPADAPPPPPPLPLPPPPAPPVASRPPPHAGAVPGAGAGAAAAGGVDALPSARAARSMCIAWGGVRAPRD
eukprot:3425666-Prymnesium_polylepis.1